MTQRTVARLLGLSRTSVQIIEARALEKLAHAAGGARPLAPYLARQKTGTSGRRCRRCREAGHYAAGCVS